MEAFQLCSSTISIGGVTRFPVQRVRHGLFVWTLMQKMILENGEYDLSKLFALIAELGESLNENRSLSVSLYAQANNVKVRGRES